MKQRAKCLGDRFAAAARVARSRSPRGVLVHQGERHRHLRAYGASRRADLADPLDQRRRHQLGRGAGAKRVRRAGGVAVADHLGEPVVQRRPGVGDGQGEAEQAGQLDRAEQLHAEPEPAEPQRPLAEVGGDPRGARQQDADAARADVAMLVAEREPATPGEHPDHLAVRLRVEGDPPAALDLDVVGLDEPEGRLVPEATEVHVGHRLLLHRSGGHAADERALEDDEHHDDRAPDHHRRRGHPDAVGGVLPAKNASPSGAVRSASPDNITSGSRNSFHDHMNTSTDQRQHRRAPAGQQRPSRGRNDAAPSIAAASINGWRHRAEVRAHPERAERRR